MLQKSEQFIAENILGHMQKDHTFLRINYEIKTYQGVSWKNL